MKLIPPRGFALLKPIDPIPDVSPDAGFHPGALSDREINKRNPFRFEVVAVGAPRTENGIEVHEAVKAGFTVASVICNSSLRKLMTDVDNGYIDGVLHILVPLDKLLIVLDEKPEPTRYTPAAETR